MRGRPITRKCPRCRRGAHGRPKAVLGVERTGQHRGITRITELARCLDCGHEWWSTCERLRGEVVPRAPRRNYVKPLLVGESNPYGSDPQYALYPEPPNSAGGRLCRVVLGLEPLEYLRQFDRANLVDGAWFDAIAASRARILVIKHAPSATFVLLGRRVARAFGETVIKHAPEPWSYYEIGCQRFACLPHPSGRCRAWNEPGAVWRARDLLRRAGIDLPEVT